MRARPRIEVARGPLTGHSVGAAARVEIVDLAHPATGGPEGVSCVEGPRTIVRLRVRPDLLECQVVVPGPA